MPRSIITMNGQCSGTGRFLLPEKRASAVIPLRRGSNADSRVHGGKDGRWCSREKQEGREEEGGRTDYAEGERRKAPTPRPLPQGQRVMAGGGGMDEPLVLMGWERRPDGRSGSGRIHGAKRHHRNTLARTIETRLQCHEESCHEGLVVRCSGSERGDQAGKGFHV